MDEWRANSNHMADPPETNNAGIQSQRSPKPPRRGIGRRFITALVTVALVIGATLAFAYRDRLSGDSLRQMFRKNEIDATGEAFTYESGDQQVFDSAGNGLAVASSTAIELLDGSGQTVFKRIVSYSTPAVWANSSGALFCEIGGASCVKTDMDGNSISLPADDPILTAHLNENGYAALVTNTAGYKALVSVYNREGELCYQWYSGTGYVLKACVSPDNRLLAALCAEEGGGQLHIFRLDSETEAARVSFPEQLPFDFTFMGNDRLGVISQDSLRFLTAGGTITGEYSLGGYSLLDYDLGSPNFIAVYLGAYQNSGLIAAVGTDGGVLGWAEVEREALSLCAQGRQLLVMTAQDLTVYQQDMTVRFRQEAMLTARSALLRPDGDILLLGSNAAERIHYAS